MGYTTNFEGEFALSSLPSAEVILQLNEIYDDGDKADGGPGGYCQWQLTRDLKGIEWDGGEKFYLYVEWLQWIIDNVLKPNLLELSGSVSFAGEIATDQGVILIENDKVVSKTASIVANELDELKRFKDYVLGSDYADEIIEGWKKENGSR